MKSLREKWISGLRRHWLLLAVLVGLSFLLYAGLSPGGSLRGGVARFVEDVQSSLVVAGSAADPEDSGERLSGVRTGPMEGRELWTAGVALAIGTLISEDLTCIAAGLLVAQKVLPFWAATLACLVGIVVGDILLLLGGRGLRRMAWESSWVRLFVRPEAILHGEHWIERKGPIVALISRFTPGTRLAPRQRSPRARPAHRNRRQRPARPSTPRARATSWRPPRPGPPELAHGEGFFTSGGL